MGPQRATSLFLAAAFAAALVLAACSTSDESSQPAEPTDPATAPTQTPPPVSTPTSTPLPDPTPVPTATPVPTSTPAPTSEPAPTPEPTPTLDIPSEPLLEATGDLPFTTEQVNEMVRFVERAAGRPFLYPPKLIVQSPDEFRAGLLPSPAEAAKRVEQASRQARRMQALGFTELGVDDLVSALNAGFVTASGYYSAIDDTMYMPTGYFTDRVFADVMVHELVHALDAQHVDGLFDPDIDEVAYETGNYELFNAWVHVIEGRASAVDTLWRWPSSWGPVAVPDRDELQAQIEARQIDETIIPVPEVFTVELLSRYRNGPIFIKALGGLSETWDLLERPPTTTEQVLVPQSIGEPVIEVETPEADGPILETRVVGALDLAVLLDGRGSISSLARGWAGGASVMWGDDETTCIRTAVATDTEADRERMFSTFERWAAALAGRVVVIEGDLIVATSCAPFIP